MPQNTNEPVAPTKGLPVLNAREQKSLDKLLLSGFETSIGYWNGVRRVKGDARPGDVVRNRKKTYRVILPHPGSNRALVQNLDTDEISEMSIGYFTYAEPRITVELQSFAMRVKNRRANEINAEFQKRIKLDPTVDNFHSLTAEYWDELQTLVIDGGEPDMHERKILANGMNVVKTHENAKYIKRRTVGGFSLKVRNYEPGCEFEYQEKVTLPPEALSWGYVAVGNWVYTELTENRGVSPDAARYLHMAAGTAFDNQSGHYLTTFIKTRKYLLVTEAEVIPTEWESMVDQKAADNEPLAIIDGWL